MRRGRRILRTSTDEDFRARNNTCTLGALQNIKLYILAKRLLKWDKIRLVHPTNYVETPDQTNLTWDPRSYPDTSYWRKIIILVHLAAEDGICDPCLCSTHHIHFRRIYVSSSSSQTHFSQRALQNLVSISANQ